MSGDSKGCVIALDIGTTKIKCQILNEFVTPVGSAYRNVKSQTIYFFVDFVKKFLGQTTLPKTRIC